MKNYNLEKKSSFWSLYAHIIKGIGVGVLSIVAIVSFGCTIYINMKTITNFISSVEFLYLIASLVIIIVGSNTFYNGVLLVRYLIRQQYIPLTKEELCKNNIDSCASYNDFLKSFLYGFSPIRSIRVRIYKSSFLYLLTDKEKVDVLINYYLNVRDYSKDESKWKAETLFLQLQNMTDEEIFNSDSLIEMNRIKFFCNLDDIPSLNPLEYNETMCRFGRYLCLVLIALLIFVFAFSIYYQGLVDAILAVFITSTVILVFFMMLALIKGGIFNSKFKEEDNKWKELI